MNLLRLLTLMGAALLVTYILITAASIHEGPLSFEPVGKSSFRTLASVSPPTRQELGRATWTLLHKMAAMYPKEPTEANKRDAAAFFDAFSQMYPCDECAGHFREMLAEHPPDFASNAALTVWLCERHNQVNTRLGKPVFECNQKSLEARWGGCGCEETSGGTPVPSANVIVK